MTTQVEAAAASTTTATTTSYLDLIGSKLRRKMGSQMNEHNNGGSSIPAFAKAQLEKLGWKEGDGLGKRRQGMASHIKVVQRAEGLGLGESTLDPALHQSLAAQDWWKNSVGNTLAKLASKTKDKKKKKKTKSKDVPSTKIYTDEELFQATGGARFGMRAQTRQQAKWKRAESNISAEEEEEAKRKVEWDGMTAPQVLLKDNDIGTTTTKSSSTENGNSTFTTKKKDKAAKRTTSTLTEGDEKEQRKREKKEKKKKRRRKEEESTGKNDDDKPTDDDGDDLGKKSKHKSKKQKVSKNS